MPESAQKPPEGLDSAGRRLWTAILADVGDGWRLDARELHLLERSCRVEDELRILEAVIDRDGPMATGSQGQPTVHPALSEARQLRLVQQRLLGAIELCDPRVGSRSADSVHGARAARARWS